MNSNNFLKTLGDFCHQSFKKVRIKSNHTQLKNIELEAELKLKTSLEKEFQSVKCDFEKEIVRNKLCQVDEKIVSICSDINVQKITQQISCLNTTDGSFSQTGVWKVKSKVCPRPRDPPMAKRDVQGNLITAVAPLKKLYIDTYRYRLRHRNMKPEYQEIYQLKTQLWELRFEELKLKESAPWDTKNLMQILKKLKNNKTRDPSRYLNEIFKPGIIGQDLAIGLLDFVNGIKTNLYIPDMLKLANISTIYKNKGSRQDLNNDCGIFGLSVLRNIIDKLIYEDKYSDIDKYMSDSNIGARQDRNIRNHLFIIYGIINSVLQGEDSCVDLQIYDLIQAFDALWLDDCMNNIYDAASEENRDDKLALIYEMNTENKVAVNTAVGQTERVEVRKAVMQGGTWGPLMCSNHIDTLGNTCLKSGSNMYLYKKMVNILPLAMVDDLLGVAKCGLDSLHLNTFINSQIELKK